VDREIATSPIDGFDLKAFTGRFKNLRYLNRGAALSVAAAMNAVKGTGLAPHSLSAMGLFVGAGPNLDLDGECRDIRSGRLTADKLQALWILRFLPNTAASVISALAGIHGESLTVSTACTASLQAIGEAFRRIRYGFLETALAGGGDSRLSPGGIMAYKTAQALFRPKADPKREYAPFDKNRNGFIPGEGGAFFVLESVDHARAREARILAEICGYGCSLDGHGMTAPAPAGKWPEQAVRSALEEARTSPEAVDLVAAHGTGTPLNDAMEANLIARLYGNRGPRVIALKSWVGHTASACGAVELGILLACLKAGFAPEIRNLKEPCHENVDFVRSSTAVPSRRVVLQSFGFGGQNSALVIKPFDGLKVE
jgi:3-oxoacyl-[acyl-carrier-protein] synthase II